MNIKKWEVSESDRDLARENAEECGIDSLAALILAARGITDPFDIDEMLDDEGALSDPFEFPDMDKAVCRIEQALSDGENICVYGDYDADGVTSTAILYHYLKSRGANVIFMVPEREEGYGLNYDAINKMKSEHIDLMITVDNGISAVNEIAYAATLDIDTVVTDHHLPQEDLPRACAVVDPYRADCYLSFKDYSGAGVALKLVCALEGENADAITDRYIDLAAVGTIADLMPLKNENRTIVKRGISLIEKNRPGFEAVINAAGLKKRSITSTVVSFTIAPRINAAGRVGSCMRAVNLLLADNETQALEIAADINESNLQRQAIEHDVLIEAERIIKEQHLEYDRVLVVCGENWKNGIIGIVAARLCEKYGRPAIVLTNDGGEASGSARSTGGFELYDAINSCADILEKFGGHAQAAGISLKMKNVDAFRKMINEYAQRVYGDMPFTKLTIDCKLKPSAFTPDMVHSLDILAPFGASNPVPVFGLFGMTVERVMPLSSGKHLRIEASRDGATVSIMAFGSTTESFGFSKGDVLDFAVTAEVSEYLSREQVTLTLKDCRASGLDQERLMTGVRAYERFMRCEKAPECRIDRDAAAAVWRAVKDGFTGNVEKLMLKTELDYSAVRVVLDAFCELGIINYSEISNSITVIPLPVREKVDLDRSDIFIRASRE